MSSVNFFCYYYKYKQGDKIPKNYHGAKYYDNILITREDNTYMITKIVYLNPLAKIMEKNIWLIVKVWVGTKVGYVVHC